MSRRSLTIVSLLSALVLTTADPIHLLATNTIIAASFGSLSRAHWLMISSFLLEMTADPAVVHLQSKVGTKGSLITALSLYAIGSLSCAYATTFGLLLAGRAVTGLASTLLSGLVVPSLMSVVEPSDRPKWNQIRTVVHALGHGLGGLLGGILLDAGGWQWVFLGPAAVSSVVIGLIMASSLPDSSEAARPPNSLSGFVPTAFQAAVGITLATAATRWTPIFNNQFLVALASSLFLAMAFRRAVFPLPLSRAPVVLFHAFGAGCQITGMFLIAFREHILSSDGNRSLPVLSTSGSATRAGLALVLANIAIPIGVLTGTSHGSNGPRSSALFGSLLQVIGSCIVYTYWADSTAILQIGFVTASFGWGLAAARSGTDLLSSLSSEGPETSELAGQIVRSSRFSGFNFSLAVVNAILMSSIRDTMGLKNSSLGETAQILTIDEAVLGLLQPALRSKAIPEYMITRQRDSYVSAGRDAVLFNSVIAVLGLVSLTSLTLMKQLRRTRSKNE